MSKSNFLYLLAGVYLAPHLSTPTASVLAIVLAILGLLASLKERE